EKCYAGTSSGESPNVGVVVTEGSDVATLLTQAYSGISRFNVNGGWNSGAPLSRGTVFTDRDLYQPGERGEFTGIAYYVSGNAIVADRNADYNVTLRDPSNGTTSLGSAKTDEFGVFSVPLQLSKQQALGYYSIEAAGPSGNQISGGFRVAEFKPPNFKMTLTLSATAAPAGSSVTADATAAYLFGAPLQGGTAHAYVTRDIAYVQPKGWDDYSFGPQWFWPEQTPSFDTDVLQKDLTLDAQGKTSLDVPVPKDMPFPMTYGVDVEATDISNLSVSDNQNFLALPSDAIIGLTSDVVGQASKPMPIRAIVTDAGGKTVAGRSMHFELQKMNYTSATQSVEGGENAQQAVKYETVATADATSGDRPVTVNLTPTDPGPYRVRANFGDSSSTATATDLQVFAFGAGEVDWGQSDKNNVAVKLDKKSYAIGETATALVASPFDTSDVYVSVVRGDTLYRTTMRGVKGAVTVKVPITAQMLPNAAIETVVVRRGAPIATVKPGSLDTLSRVGMAAFNVSVADRYLELGITPAAPTVQPGSHQSVNFALTTKGGAPVKGEVVAMVVNDAILQLSGYRLPDLVQTVYADQPISTMFSDNREGMVLKTQTPPLEKGFGYGGGYLAGAASTRVRANFLPMAYYGAVKTDASGKASVNFTMPDDLTTWRVMAVAVGGDDAHFATQDGTFISTQPLITNALLPQFARTGDTFDGGVSISNQTGTTGALALVLQLTGGLAFQDDKAQTHSANEQAAAGMQGFRYPITVGTPGPATFTVDSKLGTFSDAFTVPFVVSDEQSTDSVIESGATAKGTANVPIGLDRGGYVKLTLANSIVPQFAVPSDRWMTQDMLPLADDASSRLITASALQQMRQPYGLKLSFDPVAAGENALQIVLSLQGSDGGFKECARAKESDPVVTSYAVTALLFARSHGVTVSGDVLSRANDFLSSTLANPGRFKWCDTPECKARLRFEALWALAAAGDRRTDFLGDVVAAAANWDTADQARVARYLMQTPGWQERGTGMADHLLQTEYVTGRYSTANVTSYWGWMGSLVDAQSQMLLLLLDRHAPVEQLDGAVRALVAQQCKCGWQTMYQNATALMALSAYAAVDKPAAGTATVKVGDATVVTAQFGSTAS
ncbi:MAG: alpha-2-macroglobulin family protein, partial [Candidatus Eremiobacteraeota bacterium]|nr:alpha-2-macroglobulin family protein [Candidatus Eremiobacteraeota bacterium]